MRSLSPLNFLYFWSFNCFSIQFSLLDSLLLFVFNVFVSFSGLPKGASTVTKGFACSLQCKRAKFVF